MSKTQKNAENLFLQSQNDLISHDITHRKKIGAYYTPESVSSILSAWGIRCSTDTILEPCFGGCTFLEAARERLQALGAASPEQNLFGCDLDPLAFSFLQARVPHAKPTGHFFRQDFLTLSHSQLKGGKVDLVIGNPPYIGYGRLADDQRKILDNWTRIHSLTISRRANLWAYFVLHALQFIKVGGRLGLVLPGSFLYTEYAQTVRDLIAKNFEKVVAISLVERLFTSEGTDETTVILLADGFQTPSESQSIKITYVDHVTDLPRLLESDELYAKSENGANTGYSIIPANVMAAYNELSSRRECRSFGDLAKIRIGLVTGDTGFFVRSRDVWSSYKISARHLRYILPKSKFVRGARLTKADVADHISSGVPCLAISTPVVPREENLLAYLGNYSEARRNKNVTFNKRKVWHRFLDDYIMPSAFFVFMTGGGPRLVLNEAQAACTNSVYCVYFEPTFPLSAQKLAVISMHTTFSQLGAEMVGHARGAGALKLEPSRALGIRVYLPKRDEQAIDAVFSQVDAYLRSGNSEAAQQAADEFIFGVEDSTDIIRLLRIGLLQTRTRRTG
ncbi:HsdM family class I SAM-dependent methyltransferase [Massilia sp. UBA6681]|uniref:HsdM family class I SAM-dependent methyltransferase n=1 Tax=Massilia sp. UBA6681 TaxID=1946839 RepID=UPI0025C1035B|nr:N-6 DNA methylase [Massilia sp. UBA6681]